MDAHDADKMRDFLSILHDAMTSCIDEGLITAKAAESMTALALPPNNTSTPALDLTKHNDYGMLV